jgi:hypothetical protein
MAFSKEVLDEILKDYHGPDDFYGPQGIMKQLTKALVERTMGFLNKSIIQNIYRFSFPAYVNGRFPRF